MANLVGAYAVGFRSDVLSGTALGLTARYEDFGRLLWSIPGTGGTWPGMVLGPASHERMCSGEPGLETASRSVFRERVFR